MTFGPAMDSESIESSSNNTNILEGFLQFQGLFSDQVLPTPSTIFVNGTAVTSDEGLNSTADPSTENWPYPDYSQVSFILSLNS